MSRGHDATPICHSGNGQHFVLIEPDDDGVIHGHSHHEHDYPAMDFGSGYFCADNPIPPGDPVDPGHVCPGGVTVPSNIACPVEEETSTTSTTIPATTTTTTSPSSPVESTPTTGATGGAAGPSSSTTPPSTTLLPATTLSSSETSTSTGVIAAVAPRAASPVSVTELPHTGGGMHGIAVGIALICAGVAMRVAARRG